MRENSPSTVLGSARGMCRDCRTLVDARYVTDGRSVFLERRCPTHGRQRARVAERLSRLLGSPQGGGEIPVPDGGAA